MSTLNCDVPYCLKDSKSPGMRNDVPQSLLKRWMKKINSRMPLDKLKLRSLNLKEKTLV